MFAVIRHNSVFQRTHKFELPEEVIGRSIECGICLPDVLVSRRHATISRRLDSFVIHDQKSRNGTLVNGKVITEEHALNEGAVVNIGPYSLTFSLRPAVVVTPMAPIIEESTERTRNPLYSKKDHEGRRRRLTEAQVRVYDLLVDGLGEREISICLGIAVNTVHEHVKAIYKRLGVSSRIELLSRLNGQPEPK